MSSPSIQRSIRATIMLGYAGVATSLAFAAVVASNPLVVAVRHNDCVGAVKLINPDADANDSETAFLAGRMLDEGICVQKDPTAAAHYFARSADLGDHSAEVDYAAKVGMGEGEVQNYERAGMLCRQAGLDAKAQMQTYSVGYACTVGAVAAEKLRESLPKGAFRSNSGELMVEFTPSTSQMRIHSIPRVAVDETHTGSNLKIPLIDAPKEIDKAWRNAMAAVPKPDVSHLDSESIELSLDVDMTLEPGSDAARHQSIQDFAPLSNGDLKRSAAGGQ